MYQRRFCRHNTVSPWSKTQQSAPLLGQSGIAGSTGPSPLISSFDFVVLFSTELNAPLWSEIILIDEMRRLNLTKVCHRNVV